MKSEYKESVCKVDKVITRIENNEKVSDKDIQEALNRLEYLLMECSVGMLDEYRFKRDYIKFHTRNKEG